MALEVSELKDHNLQPSSRIRPSSNTKDKRKKLIYPFFCILKNLLFRNEILRCFMRFISQVWGMREKGGNKVKYQGHKPSDSEKHSALAALCILLEVSLGIKTIVSVEAFDFCHPC